MAALLQAGTQFREAYPYAVLAQEKLLEADSTITAGEMNRRKRNRYIRILQDELFETFKKPLMNLTVSQGQLLLRLIDRQTGITPYEIIHTYKTKPLPVSGRASHASSDPT